MRLNERIFLWNHNPRVAGSIPATVILKISNLYYKFPQSFFCCHLILRVNDERLKPKANEKFLLDTFKDGIQIDCRIRIFSGQNKIPRRL
jgi:hypothetical protein